MSNTLNFVLASPNDAADKIDEMENHIERLEAALRKIAELEYLTDEAMQKIAEDALDQSSPPARQENDDVYPGFRGNNEA
jgi:phage shock protein A